jgi:hypothetical protein
VIFFFQFLQAGRRWEEFLRKCPLHYTDNRGSGALNVMGTLLLSVPSGHWRYAHSHQSPTFSRGDCGYGSEIYLLENGQRSLPCLFKLRHTAKVKELVALFYNWWNPYLRFYDEEHHREAIRTRPMLMSGVSRQIQSDGRRTVKVSVLHEKGGFIAEAVTRITNELHHIRAITERWSVDQHWTLQLTRLLRRWLGGKWLPGLPDDAGFLLSG